MAAVLQQHASATTAAVRSEVVVLPAVVHSEVAAHVAAARSEAAVPAAADHSAEATVVPEEATVPAEDALSGDTVNTRTSAFIIR